MAGVVYKYPLRVTASVQQLHGAFRVIDESKYRKVAVSLAVPIAGELLQELCQELRVHLRPPVSWFSRAPRFISVVELPVGLEVHVKAVDRTIAFVCGAASGQLAEPVGVPAGAYLGGYLTVDLAWPDVTWRDGKGVLVIKGVEWEPVP